MLRYSFIAFAFSLGLPSLVLAQQKYAFFEPVSPPRAVQVVVTRGLAVAAPANSSAAIEKCAEDYCEWAEIDVRLTKDGHHVIVENETIDATTDGQGRVADLTLEAVKSFDAGSWFAKRFTGTKILTLREALLVAKNKVNLSLDCKQIDPKRLVDDIVAEGMEKQVIVHGSPDVISQIKNVSKNAIACMTKYTLKNDFASFVKDVAPAAVEIDATEVSAEVCQRFHAAGIKVQVNVTGAAGRASEVWGRVLDSDVDWVQTDDPAGFRFFEVRRRIPKFPVMIACHRGASRYAPENSVPAIIVAAKLGADFAEIDIRTSKDGKTVLVHDGSVDRTTDKKGPVRSFSYDELIGLSCGAWFGAPFKDNLIPSFDEGLSHYGETMGAYLDAKDVDPELLISMIQKYKLTERHVVYQSLEYCGKLKKLDSTVRVMPPLKRVEGIPAVAAIGAYAVDSAWSILSAEMIAECHRNGIKVFSDALGPNESVEQYEKAIKWGIDCIQTDHPLRVLRAIERLSAK